MTSEKTKETHLSQPSENCSRSSRASCIRRVLRFSFSPVANFRLLRSRRASLNTSLIQLEYLVPRATHGGLFFLPFDRLSRRLLFGREGCISFGGRVRVFFSDIIIIFDFVVRATFSSRSSLFRSGTFHRGSQFFWRRLRSADGKVARFVPRETHHGGGGVLASRAPSQTAIINVKKKKTKESKATQATSFYAHAKRKSRRS